MSDTLPPLPPPPPSQPPFSPYEPPAGRFDASTGYPDPNVRDKLKVPAILLLITSSISLLNSLWGLIMSSSSIQQMQDLLARSGQSDQFGPLIDSLSGPAAGIFMVVFNLFFLGLYVLCLLGGLKMMNVRSYGLVMTACIISSIPCFGSTCCLGMIPGIWGLVLLTKPEVKAAFS